MWRRWTPVALPVALLLGALLLSACAAPRLLDERATAPYAQRLAERAALRSESIAVTHQLPDEPPVTIHTEYVHAADGPSDQLIVCISGVLADRSSWRFLTGPLGRHHDLLLLDPPGYGGSSKPDPSTLGPDGYSPTWLARHELLALRAWSAKRNDQRKLILVAHSLAGTVVLRMLGDPTLRAQFADVRERIDGIVLIAPADIAVEQINPMFEEVVDLADWKAQVGSALGILRYNVETGIYEAVVRPEERALQGEADRIVALLSNRCTRRVTQAMLSNFRPTDRCRRPLWPEIRALEAQYANVDVPCLIIWGRCDETLPVTMGRKLEKQIPGAVLWEVPDAKHSPHQERADLVAHRIAAFAERDG